MHNAHTHAAESDSKRNTSEFIFFASLVRSRQTILYTTLIDSLI